jgi:Xaa-Pro aminopeptidase
MTQATGVAEVLVTPDAAHVLTDEIEAERLRAEELPPGLEVVVTPWADTEARERRVARLAAGPVASDLPAPGEAALPGMLSSARMRLSPEEVERYRRLCREAAEAMSEAARAARPEQRERELAGVGAEALLRRGIEPALILVGGERRMAMYRHPTWKDEPLGDRVMLVFCGRRHGLYADLTRIVSFTEPSADQLRRDRAVAAVEAAAFRASTPGATLGEAYDAIVAAYAAEGFPGAERDHHQGGITGYRGREALARPGDPTRIEAGQALAWNPSLASSKIEDTVIVAEDGLEVLTVDPAWPTEEVGGRRRPLPLVAG